MFSSSSSSSRTTPTCPPLTPMFRSQDPWPAFPKTIVLLVQKYTLSASSHTGILFLNPGVKSEDQSVLEPDACYFISGFCCFSSTCFVKCKVRPALCLRFNRPALAAFLQGALLTVSCMSESLSQFAEWSVWVYKYPCSQCHGSLVSHIECHLVF